MIRFNIDDFKPREVNVVIGRNGSGKTKLAEELSMASNEFIIVDDFALNLDFFNTLNELKVCKNSSQAMILITVNSAVLYVMHFDNCFHLYNNEVRPFQRCTDKKLREAHNLERLYRAGAFDFK